MNANPADTPALTIETVQPGLHGRANERARTAASFAPESCQVTLADGTVLPGCRLDLVNLGDLIGRGWSIIRLQPRSKLAAVKWEPYQRRRPTWAEYESWFAAPGFNVGIVTGTSSGIYVVDVDSALALTWARDHLPPCELRVRTAKGMHFYYPYSGERPMRNKCRVPYQGKQLDVDIRADGGYVVGPGSVHPSGHVYAREGTGWT